MSKQIESIKIRHIIDECADTDISYLGEYSDRRAKFSFDRLFLRDMNRNELRYFNPYINPLEGKTQAERKELYGYAKRDYERAERLLSGDWYYIGIKAIADININGINQEISSGGLWGIGSDSSKDHIEEIEKEELNDLYDQLKELGFNKAEIEEIEVEKED